jgi:hypothetical protein
LDHGERFIFPKDKGQIGVGGGVGMEGWVVPTARGERVETCVSWDVH